MKKRNSVPRLSFGKSLYPELLFSRSIFLAFLSYLSETVSLPEFFYPRNLSLFDLTFARVERGVNSGLDNRPPRYVSTLHKVSPSLIYLMAKSIDCNFNVGPVIYYLLALISFIALLLTQEDINLIFGEQM